LTSTIVNPQRAAAVGFSAGACVAELDWFELFVPSSNLRLGGGCVLPLDVSLQQRVRDTHTRLYRGPRRLDAGVDRSNKVAAWGQRRAAIKFVVYLSAHHSSHLQPAGSLLGHWLEYDGEAADNATHRLHQFLDRHLN